MSFKIALIYNRNSRVSVGERCLKLLRNSEKADFDLFNLQEAQKLKPEYDLYLRFDDGDYAVSIPNNLHPYVWWVADTHLKKSFSNIRRNSEFVDYLFCWQKDGADRLAKLLPNKVVKWLPPAADFLGGYEDKYISADKRNTDICFIGTRGKYSLRKVLLEIIEERYKNIFIGIKPHEEIFEVYSNSKIVINYSINNDINMRIFEALASGALVITNKLSGNGFDEIFERDGKYLITFEDVTKYDFIDKIDYFLDDKRARENITARAYMYIHENHTYLHRLREIFSLIGISIDL